MSFLHQPHLRLILILAAVMRVGFWLVMVDHDQIKDAEYGVIAQYLLDGKGYAFVSQKQSELSFHYSDNAQPQPSAYMMPGYTFFIVAHRWTFAPATRSVALMLVQTLFALASIVLLYRWLQSRSNERVALMSAWILALLPEFVLSASLAASVCFVHFCVVVLCSSSLWFRGRVRDYIFLTACAALYVSIRAEALLFLLGIGLVYAVRRDVPRLTCIALGVCLVLVPWTWRNAQQLQTFVPLTTSSGLNLYRGHNPYALGTWSDQRIDSALQQLPFTNTIELRIDSLYKAEAMATIEAQPARELQLSALKVLQLFTVEMSDQRSWYAAYWIPSILIGLGGLGGFLLRRRLRLRLGSEISLFIFSSTLSTVLFFCLPRYQTMLRIALIPFFACIIDLMLSRRNMPSKDQS